MVALFSATVEQFILLPPTNPICPHLLRCIRVIWLWSIQPYLWVVPFTVASSVVLYRYSCKELVPVVVVAALWGSSWAGHHVCFHSDNMAVVTILNKHTAKDHLLNNLLRCLFFYAAFYKFHYSATHIPGTLNAAADALSCNNVYTFFSPRSTGPTISSTISCPGLSHSEDARLDLSRVDQSFYSLFTQGIAINTLTSYKSAIRCYIAFCTQGIATNTLTSHKSGIHVRCYIAFCTQFSLPPLPLTDSNLCWFVAFLHDQQLSSSSIQLYLSALHFFQIWGGGLDPSLADFPQLHYVVCAVRCFNPIHRRPSRLPITPASLRHLYNV